MSEKNTYIVRPGRHFGKAWEYGPGDKVLLTQREAAPLIGRVIDEIEVIPEPEVGGFTELPDRVVLALASAGIDAADLPDMSDDEIVAIDGIGPSMLVKIREATNGADSE